MTTSGEGMLLRSRTVPRVWIGQDENSGAEAAQLESQKWLWYESE
jgi:hypothetical protein